MHISIATVANQKTILPTIASERGKKVSQTKRCKLLIVGILSVLMTPAAGLTADKLEFKTMADKINYSVGYQIGGDFKSQGVEVNQEALIQGIRDAINNNKPKLTPDQMNTVLSDLKQKIVTEQKSKDRKSKDAYRKASATFLKDNAKKDGVTVLPSGVQYKMLRQGSEKKPTLKDEVKLKYRITLVDGKEVSNTGTSPRTVAMAKTLPALQEVLLLMGEGGKSQVVFLTNSASASRAGRDALDDLGVVVYELELISVNKHK